MEPLSLATNIVAAVQAAAAVNNTLRKIRGLRRDAPEELLQFHNEESQPCTLLWDLKQLTRE